MFKYFVKKIIHGNTCMIGTIKNNSICLSPVGVLPWFVAEGLSFKCYGHY